MTSNVRKGLNLTYHSIFSLEKKGIHERKGAHTKAVMLEPVGKNNKGLLMELKDWNTEVFSLLSSLQEKPMLISVPLNFELQSLFLLKKRTLWIPQNKHDQSWPMQNGAGMCYNILTWDENVNRFHWLMKVNNNQVFPQTGYCPPGEGMMNTLFQWNRNEVEIPHFCSSGLGHQDLEDIGKNNYRRIWI